MTRNTRLIWRQCSEITIRLAILEFGRTTISTDFEKPYVDQQAYRDALDFQPDVVVIMLGTNDAFLNPEKRDNLTIDYQALIQSFENLPTHPQVYVTIPPPVFNNSSRTKRHHLRQ